MFLQIRRRDARDPLVSPASQDRGRLACKRLYSTANERGLISWYLKKFIFRDTLLNLQSFR
ncbi:MAG: hypothetical protein LBP59_09210 [Planctomycetaceae bacterium]|nr:hypothetical protein [Planctomycetaceae bacterium]